MVLDWASGVVSRPVSGLTAAAVPAADYTGGCPLYAPPEVADAIVHGRVPEPSEAADVWSFAESMRVALGGARPWGGGGEPAWSRIARGDLRRPFPPGTARRWPEFAALMARALDPDPRARPSADEIACVLRDAVSYRARTGASAWTVAGASRPVRGIRSWSPLVCPRRLRWV
jgi:serine/threonine protein kinase